MNPVSQCALTILVAGACYCSVACSQGYPTKPVRMVVAFAPGGTTDVVGRIMAKKLSERFGQAFVLENRPGAATNVGTQSVARAPADGYALLFSSSTPAVNASLYPNPGYDFARDFVAISPVATSPAILTVHPSLPVRTVKELIALARARPGELLYASAGNGSATHLAGELFKSLAGVNLLHIAYKGAGPAMTDLLGGHVQAQFGFNPGQVMAYHRAGKLRALAVTTDKRLSNIPELPTMQEAGVKDYETSTWYGVLAPVGTPPDIVSRIHAQIALGVKELADGLVEMGVYPVYSTQEQFAAFIRSEIVKWAEVVKRSKVKVE
jgi:tripartite-type tricarboxylate transporter receptor subunit TctC